MRNALKPEVTVLNLGLEKYILNIFSNVTCYPEFIGVILDLEEKQGPQPCKCFTAMVH